MAKILFGFTAVVASLMLVESLTCNQCRYGLGGFCLSTSTVTCFTNTTCFTGKATFTGLSSVGFNIQGCLRTSACNLTTTESLLGVSYTVVTLCCSTDQCNPAQISGAPSTKITLTAAIGVAVLAFMWGSIL
ncbi:sperm acrosome membrane-associated protein 4-like [Micropterus salmoides]|uniref:sperm acrosome membrane-associated protein 4-like n=1 Tax=Micropterus salmoides TaxID=27706 RepID=UPI0018EA3FDF|nr:sperm acrosome membrane-associated protein 4-like [Micropterus salmoides]